jgi:PhnB protein
LKLSQLNQVWMMFDGAGLSVSVPPTLIWVRLRELDARWLYRSPATGRAAAWKAMNIAAHIVVRDAARGLRLVRQGLRRTRAEPHPAARRQGHDRRDRLRGLRSARRKRVPRPGILTPLTIGGTATVLQINTDDADGIWTRALDAGAETRHELADTFWGERHGQLTDPFGHRWNIAQRVRDVPHDEVVAAAAHAFGSG